MATHTYIIDRETKIIATEQCVRELGQAAALEMQQGGNSQNRDVWATTIINLASLRRKIDEVLPQLEAVTGRILER